MPGQNELADVIAMLYHGSKQDGLLFVGSQTQKKLLQDVQGLVPELFKSDCPVFLPREYSNIIELRLDNNIVFYENHGDGIYHLTDIFAVNGGPEIILPLGTWEHSNKFQFKGGLNRWDRRTDLMGAKFENTLRTSMAPTAYLSYDNNGTVIGSGGTVQEKLFYMTENLNLTIETKPSIMLIKGETKKIACYELLPRKMTDVCSGEWTTDVERQMPDTYSVIITERPSVYTLSAGATDENTLDVWAFIEVFGLSQWLLYSSILIMITLAIMFDQILLEEKSLRESVSERFAMTYLFFLQQGEHPQKRHISIRIMSLTLSMVTLVLFIYYANDITAKMTAGMPPHPVRNFEDVLDHGYKVIAVGYNGVAMSLLRDSKVGTAKHTVYKLYFENDDEKSIAWHIAIRDGKLEEAEEIVLPWWHDITGANQIKAVEKIKSDKNTLYYQATSSVSGSSSTIFLKMDDSSKQYFGLLFSRDSEYLPVFRHYALKGFENGIFQKIDLMEVKHCVKLYNQVCWPVTRLPIKIGMTEPGPLSFTHVMFPFLFLGAGMVISLGFVIVEKVVKMSETSSKNKRSEVGFHWKTEYLLHNFFVTSHTIVDFFLTCKLILNYSPF